MKNIAIASIVLISTSSFAMITTMPLPISVSPKAISEKVLVKSIKQHQDLMPGSMVKPVSTTLEVDVMSSGCTEATDFKIDVLTAKTPGGGQVVTIVRTNPDLCEMSPMIETVTLETTKIGLTSSFPVRIANPLLAEELITH